MLNSYEVPIIPNDLRREETMVHIIGALNQLTKISNDIFAKIGSKCDEFQGKITNINQRVDTANAKLEVLKATKKATVVFSSARQAIFLVRSLRPSFSSGTLVARKAKTSRAFSLLWKLGDFLTASRDTPSPRECKSVGRTRFSPSCSSSMLSSGRGTQAFLMVLDLCLRTSVKLEALPSITQLRARTAQD